MKVVHVESGMHLYGGALQVWFLLNGLQEYEGENILVCPRGSAIADAAREVATRVHAIPMGGDTDLTMIGRLCRILREEQADLVHLHSRRGADTLGGIAARLAGIPAILSRRVDNPEPRPAVALKYRLYHRIITISEGIRRVLLAEGVPANKVRCIPSAVDTSLYRPRDDRAWLRETFGLHAGERAIGMIAQFIPRKGHRVLLDAAPAILSRHPSTRFLLFGKGPQEEAIHALCRERGLVARFVFAGFRDDLAPILPALDLVVHPAYMEGLGVSLLQAAACEVPIVACRTGGIPEVVRHGENGELVEPGDASALAAGVSRILGDEGIAARYGARGRRLVEREFSIPTMVAGNRAVYESVLVERCGNAKP